MTTKNTSIENQKILRSYLEVIEINKEQFVNYELCKIFFTVIHNFLTIEEHYSNLVKSLGKEINRHLNLEYSNDLEFIGSKFKELYNTDSKVRLSVETFENINELRGQITSKHFTEIL